ncbi:MAG: G5 domain-containing protein [Senegalia sp. (in: firmicutes)]|uniref:G5 domain-containing protein n=1 Tax=Senegalia sp. (in: firmicutes) TaxID=1924098 RepID=UPI003F9B4DE7
MNYDVNISIDENLPKGEKKIIKKGRKGYKVKVYRIIYEDNKLKSKNIISSDYYKANEEIIILGN